MRQVPFSLPPVAGFHCLFIFLHSFIIHLRVRHGAQCYKAIEGRVELFPYHICELH
ncbi:hypothetical protein Ahy_A03g010680 isoform E [Arachis hypogaea]|uniref:Uncharacterized protein n=1 Tax=Arachis hypogaea TaxID=3818 RepID=A0A445DN54_ARAHY|nr:hypothetical protein Ahy_A03g010680 isoform E [Arachis hypogaea]